MKSDSIHGSIINIDSVNGDAIPVKDGVTYSVSKAAVDEGISSVSAVALAKAEEGNSW